MKCTCEHYYLGYKKCPLCEAAPELLNNLKDMIRRFEGCLITNGTDKEFERDATAHARAAIQKAGGRS